MDAEVIMMADKSKAGIVLAPYGSLYSPALATYERIVQVYEKKFSGYGIRLAFTSSLMRKRLAEKKGINVPGLLGALQELQDLGCNRVAVQSLQIVPGGEFHQIAELVHSLRSGRAFGVPGLELGLPLLSGLSDCRTVSSMLPALISRAGVDIPSKGDGQGSREAVLLAGHGTGHPADALYCLLAGILKSQHRNVYLASIEGALGLEDILPDLRESGAESILLMPFMLVAGGHAEKDLFGADPQSWKSILEREGYAVRSYNQGLGDSLEIVSLFLERTKSALEKMAEP